MNTAHSSGKHYRPEDFERPRFWRRRPGLVITLVILSTITHYLAYLGGAHLMGQECRAQAAAAASLRPTCAALVSNGLTQWNCSESEFREHTATCANRGSVPSWFKYIKPKSPPKEQVE